MAEHKSFESGKAGVELGFSAEEKERLRALALEAIRCRCLGQALPRGLRRRVRLSYVSTRGRSFAGASG
jgi:hypothetical protein